VADALAAEFFFDEEGGGECLKGGKVGVYKEGDVEEWLGVGVLEVAPWFGFVNMRRSKDRPDMLLYQVCRIAYYLLAVALVTADKQIER
jgi:hypothetical protein